MKSELIKTICRNIFENMLKHKLEFKGHTLVKELQKPSVIKTYSVGFNHNHELPNKKGIKIINPS